MFEDDTNLFCSHQDMKELLRVVNSALENVFSWFNTNKISLKQYIFFTRHNISRDNILLKLPTSLK